VGKQDHPGEHCGGAWNLLVAVHRRVTRLRLKSCGHLLRHQSHKGEEIKCSTTAAENVTQRLHEPRSAVHVSPRVVAWKIDQNLIYLNVFNLNLL